MPPKRKKGRPPGSKNRKPSQGLLNKYNNSSKTLECKVCLKTFRSSIEYAKHYREGCKNFIDKSKLSELLVTKATFSCNECSKKFRFSKSFKAHCLNEHSKLPDSVACDVCPVRCPNKVILVEHIKKVHERDLFLCPNCNKEFVRRSHVLRHMGQSGCSGLVASFPCEICDAKFTRKDNLMVHIRLQHVIKNHFFCKSCDYSTRNFSKLINHWNKTHADPVNQLQCDHCGKYTSSRAAMAKHLEIHGDKKYACDVCGYSTYTIEVMRRHVLTHVEEKPFKCSLCSKSYIQRVQLQRHMDKHAGNACAQCNLTFNSRAKLFIHSRQHQGLAKLYCPIKTCTYSTKQFMSEASLENHLKVHLDEKSYECEVCKKKFHSEVNLRRHLDTHTLERPRRCMYCVSARAYVRGEQLVRHVRKLHPALFRTHLQHVRSVLGTDESMERVKKSEIELVLNLLDAESDRILQGCSGSGVLYGGMQDVPDPDTPDNKHEAKLTNNGPLMCEEELTDNLKKLLAQLIDNETLELFGWPEEPVDEILEKVIEQCGAKAADRGKWSRVQRLRENTKHLFVYVIEDKAVARMLATHTIDQIIKHILMQVCEDDNKCIEVLTEE